MTTTGTRFADGPTAFDEIIVDAPPAAVWPLISDPPLLAELSEELQRVEWIEGGPVAASGSRFRGHNARPQIGEWSTESTVVVCEVNRMFRWVVGDLNDPVATWTFSLTPDADSADGGRTLLRQHARMGPGPSGITVAIERWPDKEVRIVTQRLQQWEQGIATNLANLKQRAEAA